MRMNKLLVINIALFIGLLVATTALASPLMQLFKQLLPQNIELIAITPEAGLMTMFMVSIALTLLVCVPVAIVSLYLYIKPALYETETRFMRSNVLVGIALFLAGSAFGLFSYIRFGIPFFVWANGLLGMQNYWSLQTLVAQSLLASLSVGVTFLFPVVLNNMIHYNIIKVETLRKHRIPFAFGLAILIIILPFLPNNPIEQAVVFIPIYGLYEATIFMNRKHSIAIAPAEMLA